MEMKYCMECGTRLHPKMLEGEGEIPYCDTCGAFRFPVFNTAVSMIVMNEARDQILLIEQYGKPGYVLVAGYVNKGEDAEAAARREAADELGLTLTSVQFNRSRYFAPSNTLMLNFTVTAAAQEARPNTEIDRYNWFSVEEARQQIRQSSLAQAFLEGYLTGSYPWD